MLDLVGDRGGSRAAARRAFAERVKWRYDAEVIEVKDPDGLFDSVRLGNAVFGTISYELTAASEGAAPGATIYLLPFGYPIMTMSVAVGPDEILTFTPEIEAVIWRRRRRRREWRPPQRWQRILEWQRQLASASSRAVPEPASDYGHDDDHCASPQSNHAAARLT